MAKKITYRSTSEPRLLDRSLLALIIGAILLGGQASGNALFELVIQTIALVTAFAVLDSPSPTFTVPQRFSLLIIIGMMAIFAIQLTPLPYSVWAALNRVETAELVLKAFKLDNGWRPLSLTPHETVENLFLLLPPIAAYFATAKLGARGRNRVVLCVAVMAALSVALGYLQYASGGNSYYFYSEVSRGYATGFFSNRNHQADLAILGLLMCFALFDHEQPGTGRFSTLQANLVLAGAVLYFGVGVLATGSRMGFLLGGFACVAILLRKLKGFQQGALGWLTAMAMGAFALIAIATINGSRVLGATIARFDTDGDMRLEVWPEVIRMAKETLPFGSGIGSFETYYRHGEPLEKIGPRFINSAHNEYLEIALETGVFGLVLMAGAIGLLGWSSWRAYASRHNRDNLDSVGYGAIVGTIIILLHSAFDYPLRTTGLAVVFAVLCSLILARGSDTVEGRNG
ncbi:MAG: O-antigen ligase family protein [Qipengyuania sp.]|uniref:O-antigen ligase family protein n=1 Tax=Qipengyuania sp. TaxID=2004515 RepID=UPI003002BAA1